MDKGVIDTDAHDRRVFKEIYKTAKALSETKKKLPDMPSSDKLLLDSWAGLYKPSPRISEDVPPELELNKNLMEQAMKLPEWENLRDTSILDEWASALGTVFIGEKLAKSLPDHTRHEMEKVKKEQQKSEQFNAMTEALKQKFQEENTENELQSRADIASYRQIAGEASQNAQEIFQQAIKNLDKKQLKKAAKEAAEDTQQTIEKTEAFFWGAVPGKKTAVEAKEKFELALKLRNNPGWVK